MERYDSPATKASSIARCLSCRQIVQVRGISCVLRGASKMMGEDQEYQVAWWLAHMANDAIKMGNKAQAQAAAHIIGVQLTSMAKM